MQPPLKCRDENKETDDVIKNWMRNLGTIEFLGLWEKLNNPRFKSVEFDGFKNEAGNNTFVLSPSKWILQTNTIGLISRQGRGGGTYAHKRISKTQGRGEHKIGFGLGYKTYFGKN